MEFSVIENLNLPDSYSVQVIVVVDEWDPDEMIIHDTETDMRYIKCSITDGKNTDDNVIFTVNPVCPPIPIMTNVPRVGLLGALSFPKTADDIVSSPNASITFLRKKETKVVEPEKVEALMADPVIGLFADLEKYAKGGFKTFGEFRDRVSKVKHISISLYGNLFEEAVDILIRSLNDQERKFANLLIREIKDVMN